MQEFVLAISFFETRMRFDIRTILARIFKKIFLVSGLKKNVYLRTENYPQAPCTSIFGQYLGQCSRLIFNILRLFITSVGSS